MPRDRNSLPENAQAEHHRPAGLAALGCGTTEHPLPQSIHATPLNVALSLCIGMR